MTDDMRHVTDANTVNFVTVFFENSTSDLLPHSEHTLCLYFQFLSKILTVESC